MICKVLRIPFGITVLVMVPLLFRGAKVSCAVELPDILNWLPTNSETLVVANGPFVLRAPNVEDDEMSFLDVTRLLLCRVPEPICRKLDGQRVRIALEASRRYAWPRAGLGAMEYEGCLIIEFDESARAAVNQAVGDFIQATEKKKKINGTVIASIDLNEDSKGWTYYVALPRMNLLVCASHQDLLSQVLERMNGGYANRAFPESIPEWEHVDRNAPLWAIRHYRSDYAEFDPSSPLRPKSAANEPDSKAIGFVFWYQATPESRATCRYLSGSADGMQLLKNGWDSPSNGFKPTYHEVAPGVFELTTSIAEEWSTSSSNFEFILQAYLGHGEFL